MSGRPPTPAAQHALGDRRAHPEVGGIARIGPVAQSERPSVNTLLSIARPSDSSIPALTQRRSSTRTMMPA
jgi:hypothetical protein